MFFVTRPQSHYNPIPRRPVSTYFDDEDDYVELKRREYLAAVEQQRRRQEIEEAIAIENARHRAQLEALAAEQEQQRRRFAARQAGPSSIYGPRASPYHRHNTIPASFEGGCGMTRHRAPVCPQPQREPATHHIAERLFGVPRAEQRAPAPAPRPTSLPATFQKPVEKEVPAAAPAPARERQSDFFEDLIRQMFQGPTAEEAKAATKPMPVPQGVRQASPSAGPSSKPLESTQPTPASSSPSEGPQFSDAPKRAAALATISNIAHSFETLRRTFSFPANTQLERLASSDEPRLAFNSINAPILAYEHALSELLTKLDAVESYGFKGVRDARKELVVRVEKELDELEKKVAEALAASASPAKKAVEVPEVVVATETTAVEAEPVVAEEKEVEDAVMESGEAESVQGYDLGEVSKPIESAEDAPIVSNAPQPAPAHSESSPTAAPVDLIEVDVPEITHIAPTVQSSQHAEEAPLVDLSESILFDPTLAADASTTQERESVETPHVQPASDSSLPAIAEPLPIVVDEPAELQASTLSDADSTSDSETEDEADADAIRVSVTLDGKVQIDSNSDVEEGHSDREFEML